MLKKFLLNTLSSFVGAWLALALVFISSLILLMSMIGNFALKSGDTGEVLKKRSILKINVSGQIAEIEQANAPDFTELMQGKLESPQTLNVLVQALEEAADNDNISAVYLDCGVAVASPATLNALREAILNFKKSGKPVYAYGESMAMGSYFVATAADRIYLNPQGELALQGMSSTVPYFKGLFDKLGVQFQVVKVGTFKSAVEPYIMEHMSDPARAQMDTLLINMWGYIKEGISKQRKGITPEMIDTLVSSDHIAFAPSSKAMEAGLVDSLIYGREIDARFAWVTGQEVKDVNYISANTLVGQSPWMQGYDSKNQIAVLYATGEIADGDPKNIDYNTLVPIITKLAEDPNVKGMVLRVNSPGGSAYGSDQIGEALDYFQTKGKPLAVSMGDYAASGGYWISSCADIIFADPLTITGSIGIFGLIPNVSGLTDKLGVNVETISTNPEANFPTVLEPMTSEQQSVMQEYVERGYEQFVGRVARGRKMKVSAVKRIAEGRVWDAMKAEKIGLVDSLGSLQKAIEWTAKKANVESKYETAVYPKLEANFWSMLQSSGMNGVELLTKQNTPDWDEYARNFVIRVLTREKLQARMPGMIIRIN